MLLEDDVMRFSAVEPEDAPAIWRMETDSGQWMLNGMTAPVSLQAICDYAVNYDADPYRAGQIRFMVRDKISGEEIGLADLYDISALNHTAWLALYVMPELRGRGMGIKMINILEEYCMNILNLRSLGAKVAAGNVASIRIFTKAGYRHAGALSHWLEYGGKPMDMLLFQKSLR